MLDKRQVWNIKVPTKPNYIFFFVNSITLNLITAMLTKTRNLQYWQKPLTKIRHSGTKIHFLGTKKRFPGTKKRFPGTKKRFPGTKIRFPGTKIQFPSFSFCNCQKCLLIIGKTLYVFMVLRLLVYWDNILLLQFFSACETILKL
jgi:hypothetical protein